MDALARMSPADYGYIIGAAALVMISQMLWGWRYPIAAYVTRLRLQVPRATATQPVAATLPEARNVIAMPRNDGNDVLPRNVVRVQAQIIAHLLQAGLYVPDGKGGFKELRQTALITLATGLVQNGRPDSEYSQLRAELEPLINPRLVVAAGRPEERQISRV